MDNDIINDNETFSTDDMALAAALAMSFPVEAIERHALAPQFVFLRDSYLDDILEEYQCSELKVEVQAYYQQMRALQKQVEEPA